MEGMSLVMNLAFRVAAAAALLAAEQAGAQTTPAPAATAPPPTNLPAATAQKPVPAALWTPAQIREAFTLADSDSNGELTRAEAQRLSISPRSFEDMDSNKDGVLVRGEYEAAFSR